MRNSRLFVTGFAAALACFAISFDATAQTRTRQAQIAAVPEQKCLRALDGSCTNPDMVEAARLRGVIVSSVRVSYFGTPAGTIGGSYIQFERLFRDNDVVFGLPTSTCVVCGFVQRSK
jgi:hypothetical protein